MDPLEKIKSIFEKYTTSYHFYLRDLVSGKEYELGTKKRYPICSCFKLAVLMAYFDSLKDESELFEEVIIPPEKFSPGGGILNYFTTPVKFTYFQLAQMMMSFSDGTATDVLIEKSQLKFINEKIKSITTDTQLSTNLGTMIKTFQSELLGGKENRAENIKNAGNKSTIINYTNAIDLSKLALFAYKYKSNKYFNQILRTSKQLPRTDLFFPENTKFIGKTGSLGFGFFVNDCGVIEHKGNPIAVVGYTTEGWPFLKELVELKCGVIGVEILRHLGINDINNRFNKLSENLIE